MLVSMFVAAEFHLLFVLLSRSDAFFNSVSRSSLMPLSLLQMMISFSLFIFGCHDWLIPDDLAPLPISIRRVFFQVDACFGLRTVNPPLLRCVRVRRPRAESAVCRTAGSLSVLRRWYTQVLTINVLVPMAAGIFPAAQPWLLWAVYSLFTSHVDIAFLTTVRATLYAPFLRLACVSCRLLLSHCASCTGTLVRERKRSRTGLFWETD